MPTPDYKPQQPVSSRIMDMLEQQRAAAPDIAHEIAALRGEIAALRADLAPARSVILTGQEVVRELRRLRCEETA